MKAQSIHATSSLVSCSSAISWSGGKDSALACMYALNAGLNPHTLITMMDQTGLRSRSHGLQFNFLKAQANALGMRLISPSVSWQTYEDVFIQTLKDLNDIKYTEDSKNKEVTHCIFGDIDLIEHKIWEEKVSAAADLIPVLPLWQQARLTIVNQVLEFKFKPVICVILKDTVPDHFLGRYFDQDCIDELIALNIDPCGEGGEFHTVVVDGPIFKTALDYQLGQIHTTETTISIDFIVN